MKYKDIFSSYHPIINFLYFGFVIVFTMALLHPVCAAISFCCALTYAIYLSGKKTVRFFLVYMLPMFIMAALINPAFSHAGETILNYLPNGNPLTLESIIYGIAAAATLIAVILWFNAYNAVMTSDKFVYLFGRIIPALSLILSMTLRFVPRFTTQLKVISNAQKCIGRDVSNGSVWKRAINSLTILSIMVTWALENAIESADSMKSRGFGLPGRTAFSIYRFDKRDCKALMFFLTLAAFIIVGKLTGAFYWRYFPAIRGISLNFYTVCEFICYFAFCIAPAAIDITEDIKWKSLQSKVSASPIRSNMKTL